MGQGTLTNQGRALFATKQAASQVLLINRFLLANIPGLNSATEENQNEALPAVGHRVAELPVTSQGYVSADKVVYSLYLGTEDGDYTFNWVGLLADDDTLMAVRYIEPLSKYQSAGGTIGNAMTRNFLLNYVNAQAITNITVEASAWQFHHDVASESQRGIIEIATQAETDGGTNDTLAITPQKGAASYVSRVNQSVVAANTRWDDSRQAQFGTDADLRIYHSGGQNYIGAYSGALNINQNAASAMVNLRAADSAATLVDCITFGGATPRAMLHYNGAQRLETSINGISILRQLASQLDLDLVPGSGIINANGLLLESGNRVYSRATVDLVGMVAFFDQATPPAGWLTLDGSVISRTSYAALFAKIGTRYGAGDGATTFALKDVRADFLRALDNDRGIDAARTLGSSQEDSFESHDHNLAIGSDPNNVRGTNNNAAVASAQDGISENGTNQIFPTGGTETRPRNTAFLCCICYLAA